MKYDKDFRRLFKLSESMEIALVGLASKLGCDEEELLDAICCSFLWDNPKPLESLFRKVINKG